MHNKQLDSVQLIFLIFLSSRLLIPFNNSVLSIQKICFTIGNLFLESVSSYLFNFLELNTTDATNHYLSIL